MSSRGVHYLDARGPEGMRIFAIGDVHGRLDLIESMHARIAADLYERPAADWRIVHVGDYVDRGPDSKGVLDFLLARSREEPRVICLAGNHDVAMLDFLAQPEPGGPFARNGGPETARSYGVELDFGSRHGLLESHRRFLDAVPDSHVAFLREAPLSTMLGDFFFCHAGIKPGVPLDRQDPDSLVWIRDEFHKHSGLYDKVIVHGHTPAAEAEIRANRVNVDTGAVFSGRLTALVIEAGDKHVMTVAGERR